MTVTRRPPAQSPPRDLRYMAEPALWPAWPFLPLVRRSPSGESECGLLFDASGALELAGFRRTVVLTNLFTLPPTLEEFVALPNEAFDSFEEAYSAGWRVD